MYACEVHIFMDKELKAFVDSEYNNIYRELMIAWKLGLRREKAELRNRGLNNSGFEQSQLCDYAINLVRSNAIKIKDFIEKNQEKFNYLMSNEEIEEYFKKSIKDNKKYLELFKNELLEYFEENKAPLAESCKIKFENAKSNNKKQLDEMKKELILKNKKNMEGKKKLSKSDIIGIIGILVAIIGIIVSIISAIIFT